MNVRAALYTAILVALVGGVAYSLSATEPSHGIIGPPRPPTPEEKAAAAARAAEEAARAEAEKAAKAQAVLSSAKDLIAQARATRDSVAALGLYDRARSEFEIARTYGLDDQFIQKQIAAVDKARAPLVCKVEGDHRRSTVVEALQVEFYKAGIDADVRASGKCYSTLTIQWVLWSGPSVYDFKNGPMIATIRSYGFEKLYLRGWDRTWSWDFSAK